MELFMRFKKTTLAALCLAFVSVVAYSAAGDRYLSNPTLNKDVVIQVNKAGVTTDAIKVSGSTGAVTTRGRTDGTSPAAGEVGEVLSTTSAASMPATGAYGDIFTLPLTKGRWAISYQIFIGSITSTGGEMLITATPGNSAAGRVYGDNDMIFSPNKAGTHLVGCINNYIVTISSDTTFYGKVNVDYTAIVSGAIGRMNATRLP